MKFSKVIKIFIYTFGALAALAFLWIYFQINPAKQSFFPKCPFHSLTGLHCPGCGSQRALHDFLHGNILEGFKHNFLIGLGILVLLYKVFLLIRAKYNPSKNSNLLYHSKTPWIILTIISAFWILRNIPFEPFSYLAP